MADKTINELVAAQQVFPTDLFVLDQNGTAKKLTGQTLENWLLSFADGHGGIQSIFKRLTIGLVDTYRITFSDTTFFDFQVTNGKGIKSIEKTGTANLVDTYTIEYTDNSSSTFTVKNGAKGDKGDNTYTWIKYASTDPSEPPHSMGDIPDSWLGIYTGAASQPPTLWSEYKWKKIEGERGKTGAPATLSSSKIEYLVSSSGTVIPSGVWSAEFPGASQGKFIWTRVTSTFNSGAPVISYGASYIGKDGLGTVKSVNDQTPDSNGNVLITAGTIGAIPLIDRDKFELKPIRITNKSISTNLFVTFTGDSEETKLKSMGFKYRAAVAVPGVISNMTPYITLSIPDIDNAGISIVNQFKCYDGGVYLYSDGIPSQAIVALTMEFRKAVV